MSSGFFGGNKYSGYEIGQLMELPFYPPASWAGWRYFGVADNRIAAKADFPRMGEMVGQGWRLSGDTYNTATHFRFPDGARLRKGGVAILPGGGGYFDAPPADYVAFASVPADIDGNTMSLTVKPAAESVTKTYAALPAGGFDNPKDFLLDDNGVRVLEFACELPAGEDLTGQGMSGDEHEFAQSITLWRPGFTAFIGLYVFRRGNGQRKLFFTRQIDAFVTVEDAEEADRYAIEFNTAAGTLKLFQRVAGVWSEVTLDQSTYTKASYLAVGSLHEKNMSAYAHSLAGVVHGYTLIFNAADMEGGANYAPGWQGFPVFPDTVPFMPVGERRGSAETAGWAITLAQMPRHRHGVNLDGTPGTDDDAVEADQGGGAITATATRATTYAGGGEDAGPGESDAHSHGGVDPEHSVWCVLVRVR